MLTLQDIERMLAEASKTRTVSAASARWFDGTTWHNTSVPTGMASGSFSGRAGTMKRSGKGRTSRMPNGTRRYMVDYDSNVVAYKL